jgi:hypothetical protein
MLVCATFGGVIGGFSASAVSSQASASAIGAAIQKVSDSNAQSMLSSILAAIKRQSHYQYQDAWALDRQLGRICVNTLPQYVPRGYCPRNPPPYR